MDLFKLIAGKEYHCAVKEYDRLTCAGYVFAPSVIGQLLQLCMSHSLEDCRSSGINCCSFALTLYKLVAHNSPVSIDNYAVFKVLHSHNHMNGIVEVKDGCSMNASQESKFIQGIIECITEEDIANNVTACMFESWITSSSNLRGQPSQTGVMALGLSVQEFRKLLELFLKHSRREALLLLLQQCSPAMFSELKKDAVVALELILGGVSFDFVAIRGLLPLMSDYQLDLLNDKCWIVLLSACADNGDIDLAAAIYRFLLSRNGPLSSQILSTVVLMLMHYKTPFEAILLAQQSQQCNSLLVPPLSVLSRLKKTVDDLAHEDRMLILNRQEFHSPVKASMNFTMPMDSFASPFMTRTATSQSEVSNRMSLEQCVELWEVDSIAVKHNLINLIEYNGKLCQFGAIGSLLHGIPDATCFDVSKIVTELILATDEKSVTAFWELTLSYFSTVYGGHAYYNNTLMPQIAFQVMEKMSYDHNWEAAFSIYKCVLTFGISCLMECEYYSETYTSTVSLIVEVCLKSNNTMMAVEAMRTCQWLSVGEQDDLDDRLLCAINVGIHCISYNFLNEAIECIETISMFVDEKHHCMVSSFGSDVIYSLLQNSRRDEALTLCFKLVETSLCSRSTLSLVLHNLISQHKHNTARRLCYVAYESGVYESLTVNGDKFTLRISPGLTQLEIECLLKMYFLKLRIEEITCVMKILFVSEAARKVACALKCLNPPLLPDATSGPLCIVLSLSSFKSWLMAQTTCQGPVSYKKFKRRLTQELVVILRPYYKAKLFKSDDEFAHFLHFLVKKHWRRVKKLSSRIATRAVRAYIANAVRLEMSSYLCSNTCI